MNRGICQRYLETSIYTYVGVYKDFIRSLPDDIPSIGRLVCDQITHPSMYFTEPSPYLESAYYGEFASYPKNRFRNEDELYITAVSMIAGILRLDETGFTKNRDVQKNHGILPTGFGIIQCDFKSKRNPLPLQSWIYGFWR